MHINKEIPLIRSGFVQIIKCDDRAIIWHSLFGKPKIISGEVQKLLEIFVVPKTLDSFYDEYELSRNEKVYLEELITDHYLIPEGFNERIFLAKKMKVHEQTIINGSLISYLGLFMSEVCNFRCIYCIHFNNFEMSDRIKNSKKIMTFEVAKEAVDQYLTILRQHKKNMADVNFGGGEPLLAWPAIERVLEYCRLNYGKEFTFRFSINTNASLITPEIVEKFKKYHVKIASSLDGLRDGNDRVRLTKSGKGTFEAILRGFKNLAEQGCPLRGIAVTVNEQNFPFLDEKIIDWAIKQQMQEVRIDIDVIGMVKIPVRDIVDKLMMIRQYAQERGVDMTGFWSRPVENLNDSTIDTHVAFCGAVHGNSMCVSPSGNIYSCGYSNTQLGTLTKIEPFYAPNSKYHQFVRSRLTGAMEMCKGCMIEGQCGGGCNITQEFAHAAKTMKIKRMCNFYRQMTKELLLEQLREISSESGLEKFK